MFHKTEDLYMKFFGDSEMPLVIYTKVTKGTGPVRRLGKIEHGTSGIIVFCADTR